MEILFTKSNTFLSRAICYLTKEKVSHVALQEGKFVFHSSLCGVEIITLENFTTAREILGHIEVDNFSYDNLLRFLSKPHRYDFLALAYLAVRYAAKKWLRISIPKANLWGITGMYTCTEFVSDVIWSSEDSLITPGRLYEKFTGMEL
jgi:hypothetical protein